jgi:hypothetical protein
MRSRTGARGGLRISRGPCRGVCGGVCEVVVVVEFMMTRFMTQPTSPAFYTSPTSPKQLGISHAKNLDLGRVNPGSLGDRGDEGIPL